MTKKKQCRKAYLLCLVTIFVTFFSLGPKCIDEKTVSEPIDSGPTVPVNEVLDNHCREHVKEPRVERISEHVWAAMGYDLAHTMLINTSEGNVIVDTAMSPARARIIRQALEEVAPKAPIIAIIFTHSHIDHVGGASVWAEEGTEIWATDTFTEHFLKQYGIFRPTETVRAMRQFGHHIDHKSLPCSALGARMDISAALENGVMIPNRTFAEHQTLEYGDVTLELQKAPGETHDQLFVYLVEDETLFPGDNFYYAFPNLYTVRGSSPRPVKEWIKGLDKMRSLNPEHMIPSHTLAVHGREEIAAALTDYRDAIQWVYAEVVRAANRLEDIDSIRESVKLPPHLASKPYLQELYGQVDWSAHAIYDNNLGWFDGRPDQLYKLPAKKICRREVELMGGPDKIIGLAREAMGRGDAKWAIHLLTKLGRSDMLGEDRAGEVDSMLADSYRKLAAGIANTNGRAYLLESALELEHGTFTPATPKPTQELVKNVPLDLIFSIMSVRVKPEETRDLHQSVQFVFPDIDKRYTVTIRYGIAEVIEGGPLPYTPEPIAVMTTDAQTYREIAMGISNPTIGVATGKIKIDGSLTGMIKFQNMFQKGI